MRASLYKMSCCGTRELSGSINLLHPGRGTIALGFGFCFRPEKKGQKKCVMVEQ